MHHTQQPIIFYDGLCGLCDRSVQFILKHDKHGRFLFCSLQSNQAKHYLGNRYTQESIVLLWGDKIYDQSTAALKIVGGLGGFWRLMRLFFLVPRFVRDAVYRLVAANRYRWFGKFDTCILPDEKVRKRFIA